MEDERKSAPMGQLSAHIDRGWDLATRGDLRGAMLSAEKSLELDEESPEAHTLIGFIRQSEGAPEDALDHYRLALDLDEAYVDAMLNAAEVLIYPLERYDEALEYVREALDWLGADEIDERTDALLLEIEIHALRGDREALQKVAKELPDGPFTNDSLLLAVGRARLDAGDPIGAEAALRQAVEKAPSAEAHYQLALVHEAQDRPQDALLELLVTRELDAQAPPPPWSLPREIFQRRVQAALERLPDTHSTVIQGALVAVTDLPGAEVVAEGVDPRTPVLLDGLSPPDDPPGASRIFVYRRNVERLSLSPLDVEDEILASLVFELEAMFPTLAGDSAAAAASEET